MENKAKITGTIIKEVEYDHSDINSKFYMTYISTARESGVSDIIPVMISEKLMSEIQLVKGMRVEVTGEYRSFNLHSDGQSHLKLYVFANCIKAADQAEDKNTITLSGCVCKLPVYRETPRGKKICDVMIAVNRDHMNSDYIPVIFWALAARCISGYKVGEYIKLKGRIQSRAYNKLVEGKYEVRTAYEVSVLWTDAVITDRSDKNANIRDKAEVL